MSSGLGDVEQAIKYGDFIYIQCQTGEQMAVIEGQGMMSEGVAVVNTPVPHYDDCLFQICVRARVSAAAELQKMESETALVKESRGKMDEQTRELLQTLKRVKMKEEKMNLRAMEEKTGTKIVYGDVIQLKHCATGKWLVVDEHRVADAEPENMLVKLSREASMFAWFTLEPAAKFFFEGDTVCNLANVRFRSTPREQYLHVGKKTYVEENLLKQQVLKNSFPNLEKMELNSSLTKNAWQIMRYSTTLPAELNSIQAGDMIYIEEPELSAYAALPLSKREKVRRRPSNGEEEVGVGASMASRAQGKTVVFQTQDDGVFDVPSNSLWIIEKIMPQFKGGAYSLPIGGQIDWGEGFYLRHVNTGLYLTTSTGGKCTVTPRADASDAETFTFHPAIGVRSKFPRHGAALKVRRQQEVDGKAGKEEWLAYAQSEFQSDMYFNDHEDLASTVVVRKIAMAEKRQQLQYSLESRPILRQYSHNLQLPEDEVGELRYQSLKSYTATVKIFLVKLAIFVVQPEFRTKLHEWNVATIPYRQRLLQQQGVLDILIDLLHQLRRLQVRSEERRNAAQSEALSGKTKQQKDEAEHMLSSWLSDLSEMCFTTLRVTIIKCQENQIHASERFEVLLSYVGQGRMAMACITEMMDNPIVQEQKIGDKEIAVFMDMLRKTTLNATILRVLQAICTCRGLAIRSNQSRLAKNVFGNSSNNIFVATSVIAGKLNLALPNNNLLKGDGSILEVSDQPDAAKFFTTQLNLFASMCLSRNFTCADTVREMLPLDVLVQHIRDEKLSLPLRSALCRVIMTAHVDCSPQVRMRLRQFSFSWSKLASSGDSKAFATLTTEPRIESFQAAREKEEPSGLTMPSLKLPSLPGPLVEASQSFSFGHKKPSAKAGDKKVQLDPLADAAALHTSPKLFNDLHDIIVGHLSSIEAWTELTKELVELLNTLIEFRFYHNHPDKMQDSVARIAARLQKVTFGAEDHHNIQLAPAARADHKEFSHGSSRGMERAGAGQGGKQTGHSKLQLALAPSIADSTKDFAKMMRQFSSNKLNAITPLESGPDSTFVGTKTARMVIVKAQDVASRIPNRKRVLKFLDSVGVIVAVLLLVFLSILIGNLQGDSQAWYYAVFEYVVYSVFLLELILRLYAVGPLELFTNKFSLMDFVVVALDTILMSFPEILGGAGSSTKSLRIVRVVRLVRLLKVMRLLKALHDAHKPDEKPPWKLPEKYVHSPKIQLQAMRLMVKVLVSANRINRRAQLCIFMKQIRQSYNERAHTFDHNAGELLSFKSVKAVTPVKNVSKGLRKAPVKVASNLVKAPGKLVKGEPVGWAAKLMTKVITKVITTKSVSWGGRLMNKAVSVPLDLQPRDGMASLLMADSAEHNAPLHSTLLHMVMYQYPELVQEVLTALMMHHQLHSVLLDDVKEVQIIMAKSREDDFNQFEQDLDYLSQALETHFVDEHGTGTPGTTPKIGGESGLGASWSEALEEQEGMAFPSRKSPRGPSTGGLSSVYFKTEPTLKRLIHHCKTVNTSWLMGNQLYNENKEAQTMLRHLDAFETLKIWRMSYSRSREKRFWQRCNEFFAAFCFKNPINQRLAFSLVPQMITQLQYDSAVLCDILQDNDEIIKLLPQQFVQVVVDSMYKQAHGGHYDVDCLRLLNNVAMYNDKPDNRHQLAIVLSLTTDRKVQEKLLFLCKEGDQYEERKALVQQAKQNRQTVLDRYKNVTLHSDDKVNNKTLQFIEEMSKALPNMLNYNIQLIMLLCTCTAGSTERTNIIEARVQSLYPLKDLIKSLLDQELILDVQCALGKLFFDTYLDVEMPVQGFAQDKQVWAYLQTMPIELEKALQMLRRRQMWRELTPAELWATRQQMEYTFKIVVPTINLFMKIYYRQIQLAHSFSDRENLPASFLIKIGELHNLCLVENDGLSNELQLSSEASLYLLECFMVLRKFVGQDSVDVDVIPTDIYSKQSVAAMAQKRHAMQRRHSNAQANFMASGFLEEDRVALTAEQQQKNTKEMFEEEVQRFLGDAQVKEIATARLQTLVNYIKGLPSKCNTSTDAALRKEPLLEKLINHSRGNVTFQSGQKFISPEHQDTVSWLLDLFRAMIEQEWGFDVMDRDHLGTVESDKAAKDTQLTLMSAGAVGLCIELISTGIPDQIKDKAMLLLIALLYKEGGHRTVQIAVNKELMEPQNKLFFDTVNEIIDSFASYHEQVAETSPKQIRILLCLNLMCEGHFKPNQDILREQTHNNTVSVNLLDTIVKVFMSVGGTGSGAEHRRCPASMETTIRLASVLLEVTQGPCPKNQSHLAIGTELLETMNSMLRLEADTETTNINHEDLEHLKHTILKIFMALLEKQKSPSDVFDRILSVVHVEVLTLLVQPRSDNVISDDTDPLDAMELLEEKERARQRPLTPVQAQSLVLIQVLRDYNPSLSDELKLGDEVTEKLNDELCSVEIVWHGDLRRRFFKVPLIMAHLVPATKEDLVANVDRSCQELKYQDFLQRSRIIHSELLHMEMLRRKKLLTFFNRTVQDRATWVTFGINLVINLIYLICMRVKDPEEISEEEYQSELIGTNTTSGFFSSVYNSEGITRWKLAGKMSEVLLEMCNCAQIVLSSFTLILYTMVRAPVMYSYEYKKTRSRIRSFIKMWTTSLLAYYFAYVACAIFGYVLKDVGPLFNTILLYDIVIKNSTSRDVLRAVYAPARQIGATLGLLAFTVYVFTMSLFLVFRDDFENNDCDDLKKCFQVTLGFGLRMGGGIGEHLEFDDRALRWRYLIDFAYYAIVLIILLNIVFGIIIDTFSELRERKKVREEDTKEKCFMCGIDKATFDRDGSTVFQQHIAEEHNMWAYLKFIVAIWEQDEDDDDGLESYVRKCIERRDHEWLPGAKCIRLPNHKEGDEAHGSTQKELLTRVDELDSKIDQIVAVLNEMNAQRI